MLANAFSDKLVRLAIIHLCRLKEVDFHFCRLLSEALSWSESSLSGDSMFKTQQPVSLSARVEREASAMPDM